MSNPSVQVVTKVLLCICKNVSLAIKFSVLSTNYGSSWLCSVIVHILFVQNKKKNKKKQRNLELPGKYRPSSENEESSHLFLCQVT